MARYSSAGRDAAGVIKEKRRDMFAGRPCLASNVHVDQHRKKTAVITSEWNVAAAWDWLTCAVYGPANMGWPNGATSFDDELKRQMMAHVEATPSQPTPAQEGKG